MSNRLPRCECGVEFTQGSKQRYAAADEYEHHALAIMEARIRTDERARIAGMIQERGDDFEGWLGSYSHGITVGLHEAARIAKECR